MTEKQNNPLHYLRPDFTGTACDMNGWGSTEWSAVTCAACLALKPAAVHHHTPFRYRAACGDTTGAAVPEWSAVTCGACLLEQPMDMRGKVEYKIPTNVLSEDRRQTVIHSLADEQAFQMKISGHIAELTDMREKSAVRVALLAQELRELS